MADSSNKLFVGGISYKTNEDTLRKYFSQYGQLTNCVVMRDSATKVSRGFAFVRFQNKSDADMVLSIRNHQIDGREVEAKLAVPPKGTTEIPQACGPILKLFVGGLNYSTTKETLHDYFSQFGKVVQAQIVYDHNTKTSRGFGFVIFSDPRGTQEALRNRMHVIEEREVEVKPAIPKDMATQPQQQQQQQYNNYNQMYPHQMAPNSYGHMPMNCGYPMGPMQGGYPMMMRPTHPMPIPPSHSRPINPAHSRPINPAHSHPTNPAHSAPEGYSPMYGQQMHTQANQIQQIAQMGQHAGPVNQEDYLQFLATLANANMSATKAISAAMAQAMQNKENRQQQQQQQHGNQPHPSQLSIYSTSQDENVEQITIIPGPSNSQHHHRQQHQPEREPPLSAGDILIGAGNLNSERRATGIISSASTSSLNGLTSNINNISSKTNINNNNGNNNNKDNEYSTNDSNENAIPSSNSSGSNNNGLSIESVSSGSTARHQPRFKAKRPRALAVNQQQQPNMSMASQSGSATTLSHCDSIGSSSLSGIPATAGPLDGGSKNLLAHSHQKREAFSASLFGYNDIVHAPPSATGPNTAALNDMSPSQYGGLFDSSSIGAGSASKYGSLSAGLGPSYNSIANESASAAMLRDWQHFDDDSGYKQTQQVTSAAHLQGNSGWPNSGFPTDRPNDKQSNSEELVNMLQNLKF
eukprot:TRINITY_DN840_c0_g6_i1.p1 TRINITY_DN840_c0_g6~~TRINITY_DN840_c0_g6_i1.p1  ORF type:complete len:694 (-),score=179.57 TRINITY_DN840_c0_g6_i1:332-2413(-)